MSTDNVAVITQYIVREFLPDMSAAELAPDYDMLEGGVIDSLALLRVIDWLGERFQLNLDEVEMSPDNFRTVNDIDAFVAAGRGAP